MVAIATPRRLKVTIGGQTWDTASESLDFGEDSVGATQGLLTKKARLKIGNIGYNLPESLDPIANPSRWRPGRLVVIQIQNDSGGYTLHPKAGNLIILSEPAPPITGSPGIEVQLGCLLSFYDFSQPNGDESGVTAGTGRDYGAIATDLLIAAGISAGSISLGSWGYTIDYPIPKITSGFVQQAGALAYSANGYLYTSSSGNILFSTVSLAPATASVTINIGSDEIKWDPIQDAQRPVELAIASGTKNTINTATYPIDTTTYKYGPVSDYGYSGGDIPVLIIEERVDQQTTSFQVGTSGVFPYFAIGHQGKFKLVSKITSELAGSIDPDVNNVLQMVQTQREKYYKAFDSSGRLIFELNMIDQARGKINLDIARAFSDQFMPATISWQKITYEYDLDQIVEITDETYSPKIIVNPDETATPWALMLVKSIVTTYTENVRGNWKKSVTTQTAKGLINPGDDNPYYVVLDTTNTTSSVRDTGENQPPRTEYVPATVQLDQTQ